MSCELNLVGMRFDILRVKSGVVVIFREMGCGVPINFCQERLNVLNFGDILARVVDH